MARKVLTVVSDDLDGSEDATTVTFSLDGISYEVDLAAKNEAKLRKALEPFMMAGRRTSLPPRKSRGGSNNAAIREWAAAEGVFIPARGRIPTSVQEAYAAR